MPQTKTQLEQDLLEMIAQFTDDYIDEWTDDGNELDKLHEISDDFNHDIRKTVADHLLGLPSLQDEKHPNGKNIVNPYICNDCGEPQSEFTRNEIRKQSRQEITEALSVNIASKD